MGVKGPGEGSSDVDSLSVKKSTKGQFPVDRNFGSAFIGGPPLESREEVEAFYRSPEPAEEAKRKFHERFKEYIVAHQKEDGAKVLKVIDDENVRPE